MLLARGVGGFASPLLSMGHPSDCYPGSLGPFDFVLVVPHGKRDQMYLQSAHLEAFFSLLHGDNSVPGSGYHRTSNRREVFVMSMNEQHL